MRRACALALSLILLLTPALAAEGELLLPAALPYDGFSDVKEGDWYFDAVKLCCRTGLMNGTGDGAFSPDGILTVAEAAALSARIREGLTGEAIPLATPLPGESRAWYADYMDYLSRAIDPSDGSYFGVIPWDAPEASATRQQFLALLMLALKAEDGFFPTEDFPAVNSITALPDVEGDDVVLFFYNAGILTGVDEYGAFAGARTLRRSEAAAMAARVVDPGLRQRFVPKALPAEPDAHLSYEEELMQTEALRVNGGSIPFSVFLDTLNGILFRFDFGMAADGGSRLDWDAQYQGVDDLESYFIDLATQQAVRDYLLAAQAAALGCAQEELPQVLTPDPAAQLDHIYRAKHILVDDEATAQAVLAQLMAQPTLTRFDQLMAQYNTDPGMTSNPDGYLFTDGDMVAEFESAVKALDVGSCSTVPVRSAYGWHIILRLDPTGLPDWERSVRELLYETYVADWMSSATVTPNTVELDKLDVRGRYEEYLENLGL